MKHFIFKVLELTKGALFLSWPGQMIWRLRPRDKSGSLVNKDVKTALVAHIYYPELTSEVLRCFRSLPEGADLHVTTVQERAAEVREQVANIDRVQIHVRPNRGRDIAPFIHLVNNGVFDGYDAVLKLHTKKSPHLVNGDMRRKVLFCMLAGDTEQVRRALVALCNEGAGVVGWGTAYRSTPLYWMANKERVAGLLRRASPSADVIPAFFEGSMFWFAPDALRLVRSMNIGLDEFEEESRQLDGTLHHAIERIFCTSARAAGYSTCSMSGGLLLESAEKTDNLNDGTASPKGPLSNRYAKPQRNMTGSPVLLD